MVGQSRHDWNTNGAGLASHFGDSSLLAKTAGTVLKEVGKPFASAAKRREAEAQRQTRAAESAAESDRRTNVKADAQIKVEKAKQKTAATKTAGTIEVLTARQKEREHREGAPLRRQAARNEAASMKPVKPAAAPAKKTSAKKPAAPKPEPRKRTQSPVVKKEFKSAVGDSPVPKKVKSPVAGSDIIDMGGIKQAQATED